MTTGFRKLKRENKTLSVKVLPNGAEVRKIGKAFEAYSGECYLGYADTLQEAEFMAVNGFPNYMNDVSDLSLWALWNDALDCGETPLEDTEGNQYLYLRDQIVMKAGEDTHGFNVELLDKKAFQEQFQDDNYPKVLKLKFTEKPLRLE